MQLGIEEFTNEMTNQSIPYKLDDDESRLEKNYFLYRASKKTGDAKDEPGKCMKNDV